MCDKDELLTCRCLLDLSGTLGYFSVASCSTYSHPLRSGVLWWPSCCCLAQSILIKALSSWMLKNSHPGIWCELYSGTKFSGISTFSEFVKISISFIGLSRTVFLVDKASEKHENNPNHKHAGKESLIGTKTYILFFHLKITNFQCILLNISYVILAQWSDVSWICDKNFSTNGDRDTWYCDV